MSRGSIQFRLTAWYAGVLTLIFAVLGGLFFLPLRRAVDRIVLETDARRAHQIGELLVGQIMPAGPGQLSEAVERFYAPERNARFIRISRPDGAVLYRSGAPEDQSFDPSEVPATQPWPKPASALRRPLPGGGGFFLAAYTTSPAGGAAYLVEVGGSATAVDHLLAQLGLLFAFALPVVLVIAVGGGYLLVSRALRPVERMARKAEVISVHRLGERLPVDRTGDELERLAESLNRMVVRLEDAISNSKRFVADASHELRTPLTILRGELEGLVQDKRIPVELNQRLDSMLEETERLSKIVEGLVALSRLDAGESQAEWVRFDLGALAVSTAEQMSLLAEDKTIALIPDVPAEVLIQGDRARIKQVVVNLLDNAIKYTPEGGSVRLAVRAEGSQAVLEVADSGVGIPTEAIPHIFQRFYRADESRTRDPEGAGLGLAIVKSICNAHGAELTVESAPGQGSRFQVRFPALEAPSSGKERA